MTVSEQIIEEYLKKGKSLKDVPPELKDKLNENGMENTIPYPPTTANTIPVISMVNLMKKPKPRFTSFNRMSVCQSAI